MYVRGKENETQDGKASMHKADDAAHPLPTLRPSVRKMDQWKNVSGLTSLATAQVQRREQKNEEVVFPDREREKTLICILLLFGYTWISCSAETLFNALSNHWARFLKMSKPWSVAL